MIRTHLAGLALTACALVSFPFTAHAQTPSPGEAGVSCNGDSCTGAATVPGEDSSNAQPATGGNGQPSGSNGLGDSSSTGNNPHRPHKGQDSDPRSPEAESPNSSSNNASGSTSGSGSGSSSGATGNAAPQPVFLSDRDCVTSKPAGYDLLTNSCTWYPDGNAPDPTLLTTTPAHPTANPSATPSKPSQAETSALARSLVLLLKLPHPDINLGPEPTTNQWKTAFVGVPYWAWTTSPATRTATLTRWGYTFAMTATRGPVTYDFGDGTTITCLTSTPRPDYAGDAPSPTCGHTYQHPSVPHGDYTVTATATWKVQWTALGYSGTIPVAQSTSRQLTVAELQSIRTR